MAKYTKLSEDILKHVDGKENINSLKHCVSLMFMRRFFKLAVYQQVVVWILMKVMHQREISLTALYL